MSTTKDLMDSKAIAYNALKGACNLVRMDLNALPDEAFTQKFGGKARTVADIICEVNMVNDHIGMVIRGEEPFVWPDKGWIYATEELNSKQTVIAAFEASATKILETVEGFTREQLETPFETEDGVTTRFERCRFMALHLWYHSGQLNFIQTLLGDDAWHWMN